MCSTLKNIGRKPDWHRRQRNCFKSFHFTLSGTGTERGQSERKRVRERETERRKEGCREMGQPCKQKIETTRASKKKRNPTKLSLSPFLFLAHNQRSHSHFLLSLSAHPYTLTHWPATHKTSSLSLRQYVKQKSLSTSLSRTLFPPSFTFPRRGLFGASSWQNLCLSLSLSF